MLVHLNALIIAQFQPVIQGNRQCANIRLVSSPISLKSFQEVYLFQGRRSQCSQYKLYTRDASDKDLILNFHNEMRNKVASGQETRGAPGPQPPATNMQGVVRLLFHIFVGPKLNVNF